MHDRQHDALATAIFETVRLPLLALDADLRVATANDAFLRHFRVSHEETVGRLIYDLGNGQWDIPELRRLLGEILPEKSTVADYRVAHDFERIGRRIVHVNARRIDRPGSEDLILLAISDDTEREALRAELVGRIELADKLIDSVREGLLILDPDLRVHSASASFYETFEVEPAQTVGRLIYELGNAQWDIPELRQLLEDVLPRQRSFDDYEVTHTFDDIGERVMMLNGRRLDHQDLILLAVRDVTDVRESAARLKEVATAANIGVRSAAMLGELSATIVMRSGSVAAGFSILIVAERQSARVLGVARVGDRPGPFRRSTAVRRRQLSTLSSKIVAWCTVSRISGPPSGRSARRTATAASVMAGSGKIRFHSPKGWLAVISTDLRSWRR